jgi:hypothetical protein
MPRLLLLAVFALALSASLIADVLVLRDGSRVQGELIAVRGGVIEFEERRGFGSGRTVRFDRSEVMRIELEGRSGGGDRPIGGRPPGLRERMVTVAANTAWNDSGVDVRSGQTIFLDASGQVRWGPNRRDGPEGEDDSPTNRARPIPNRPAAGLIGRVGSGGDYFFIGGERGPIRMRSSGRLFLGINDDFLGDNSGTFRVVVHY